MNFLKPTILFLSISVSLLLSTGSYASFPAPSSPFPTASAYKYFSLCMKGPGSITSFDTELDGIDYSAKNKQYGDILHFLDWVEKTGQTSPNPKTIVQIIFSHVEQVKPFVASTTAAVCDPTMVKPGLPKGLMIYQYNGTSWVVPSHTIRNNVA